jgi:hypothetical protein
MGKDLEDVGKIFNLNGGPQCFIPAGVQTVMRIAHSGSVRHIQINSGVL